MKTKFDYIFKVLPFVGGITIILSLTKAIIFYSLFGIRILSYLDFSECLFLFLDDILLISLFLVFTIIVSIGFNIRINTFIFDNTSPEERIKIRKNREKLFKFYFTFFKVCRVLSVAILVFIILVACIKRQYSKFFPLSIYLIPLLLISFIAPFVRSMNVYAKKHRIVIDGLLILFVGFGITYFGMLSFSAYSQAREIKFPEATPRQCILILKNNLVVKTSDSLYFIGRIKNYTFFYNPKTNVKKVISNDEISQTEFK